MSMKTNCAIVGAQYHRGAQELLAYMDRAVKKGGYGPGFVKLTLQRQPENPHDPNAVAVLANDSRSGQLKVVHVGYIPRQDARAVAKVLDNGVQVRATYKGNCIAELWWPASDKEGVDEAYRRAMLEGEGL